MKLKLFFLGVFCTLFFGLSKVNSQTASDTTLLRIETSDGNTYIGTIVSQDDKTVQLKTENLGVISLQKSAIEEMKPLKPSEMKGKDFWYRNGYASTRYFFSTNGYGLDAGEGYYQNTWVLLNGVNLGVTKNFSIGVGMIPAFLFALGDGDVATPVWLTPKITIPVKADKVNLGVGVLHGFAIGDDSDGSAGIAYGTATFGPRDNNLSLGIGWGYSSGEFSDRPTISFSYIKRRNPKWAFLTENYYISTSSGDAILILSGGGRYIGKKISIDFGGFTFIATGQDVFPILPWLSLSVPFNVKRK